MNNTNFLRVPVAARIVFNKQYNVISEEYEFTKIPLTEKIATKIIKGICTALKETSHEESAKAD